MPNVLRENETAEVSLRAFGESGAGAYRPPHLMHAIHELKAEEARKKREAEEARAKAAADAAAAEAGRNALIYGKKVLGSGTWKKTKFGTMNFVEDDPTLLTDPDVLAKRAAAEKKKALRTTFEDKTRGAREFARGQIARKEEYLKQTTTAKAVAKEEALDDDERALKEYADRDALLKQYYLGGIPEPRTDGSLLAHRQRAVADMVASDAPKFLTMFAADVDVPVPERTCEDLSAPPVPPTTEPAIQMRKPALLSSILRPKRFRVDNRHTIDASRVMAEGDAFKAMVKNDDVLALPLPPNREPVRRPMPDSDGLSHAAAGTLENVTPSEFALEMARGSNDEEREASLLHTRGLRLLAGRDLMVAKRQGYGQIAANEADVLPAASFKLIAAKSAELQPAGTTKTMIMNRAIEEYERNISASSALSTVDEEKAKIERVRGTLARARSDIVDELAAANEGRARADMELLDQIDYMSKLQPDPRAKTRPKVVKVDGRSEKEKRLEAAQRRDDQIEAEHARAELARLEALRSSKAKKEPPAYGTSMLSMWPLHTAGPLAAFSAAGGAELASEQKSGMVYRQYAVLDSVAASKRHAIAEKEELIRKMQKKLESSSASLTMTDLDVRSALESSRGVGQSAAARARAAALSAHTRARASATTLGQLLSAGGDTRKTASFGDEGMPILSAAAAESEDFLTRVKPANLNEEAFYVRDETKGDLRNLRDRQLDIFHGAGALPSRPFILFRHISLILTPRPPNTRANVLPSSSSLQTTRGSTARLCGRSRSTSIVSASK
jgi:hypothetical protein